MAPRSNPTPDLGATVAVLTEELAELHKRYTALSIEHQEMIEDFGLFANLVANKDWRRLSRVLTRFGQGMHKARKLASDLRQTAREK